MKYEDLTEKEQEVWDYAYDEGSDTGYSNGWDDAMELVNNDEHEDTSYDDGYAAGFAEGAKQEQARVQFVLKMMFDSSLNMGQGNKAVQYKHAMDLLRPVSIDYSEEAYERDMEADGF